MPQSKRGRVLFALFTCLAILLIGTNLYLRVLTAACMAAIHARDWPKMHRLLQQGALINARATDQDRVLAWAAWHGDAHDIELLLQRGAHADARTRLGRPLENAVAVGNTEVVRVLLAHHVNPNVRHNYEQSTLGLALLDPSHPEIIRNLRDSGAHLTLFETTQMGDLADVKTYLAQGGSPEQTNSNGRTLLALAAQNGRVDVVQSLLAAGANVNGYSLALNSDGGALPFEETALFAAVRNGDPNMIRVLLKAGAEVNVHLKAVTVNNEQISSNQPPLVCAAITGKLDAIRLLLSNGLDIKLGDVHGEPTLSSILTANGNTEDDLLRSLERRNCTEIIHLLIQAGVDANVLEGQTLSPLSYACNYGYDEIAAVLLEHGAAVDNRLLLLTLMPGSLSAQSRSRLLEQTARTRIVGLLLSKHVDVDVTSTDGVTALMLAAEQEDVEIAQMLLTHHANIHAVTHDGRTVLGFAYAPLSVSRGVDISAERSRMIALLRSHGVHLSLVESAHFGEVSDLKTYLEQGADPNTLSSKGVPLLLEAAASGHPEAVALLLGHEAKVDSTDTDGWTALMVAAANGNTEMVRLLIQHHADIAHRNKTGKTALMKANRRSSRDLTALLTPPAH